MIIILILIAVLVVSVILMEEGDKRTNEYFFFGGLLLSLMFGGVLLITLIFIPIERMEIQSEIEQFESVQKTAERMRENDQRILESASFQSRVADENKWLAEMQYWNDTVMDIWVPDEVDYLEPIE